mmetsp:Transcript_102734/g.199129  ORF Transcript_102734/g.199129 Transcript_102734/m.199129 type:complete len:258 (+) Transcript_102734:100-873(+)
MRNSDVNCTALILANNVQIRLHFYELQDGVWPFFLHCFHQGCLPYMVLFINFPVLFCLHQKIRRRIVMCIDACRLWESMLPPSLLELATELISVHRHINQGSVENLHLIRYCLTGGPITFGIIRFHNRTGRPPAPSAALNLSANLEPVRVLLRHEQVISQIGPHVLKPSGQKTTFQFCLLPSHPFNVFGLQAQRCLIRLHGTESNFPALLLLDPLFDFTFAAIQLWAPFQSNDLDDITNSIICHSQRGGGEGGAKFV